MHRLEEPGGGEQFVFGGAQVANIIDVLHAQSVSTPFYLYDLDGMAAAAARLRESFAGAPFLIAYALKANSAGPVVQTLMGEGCGLDVVSGGELALGLAAGAKPDRIVYSGVAKSDEELGAALSVGERGIFAVQAESIEEIRRIDRVAATLGRVARVSLRVNPEVHFDELDTHANIATGHDEAKFGIPAADVDRALTEAKSLDHVSVVGLAVHIGSQLREVDAYVESARRLFALASAARSAFPLEFVDTGGGFGIPYAGETCSEAGDFIRAVAALKRQAKLDDLTHVCEPGRVLVAPYGVLIARVIQRKETSGKRWLMIDAGMNDLMRPALYQARHRVVPLKSSRGDLASFRVVGPVCESSDDFGVHELPTDVDGAVALLDAGAYGFTMASEYNGRGLPHEVFLRASKIAGVTRPRTAAEWALERLVVDKLSDG